ncbi:Brp/Blh family beta-carotene 15,15'-dioxygenase [Modestobacter sp. VKM Ac-2983]|uniref:Brp/Blh family beta-carotene 15,15'-dioxygenase n=1 Tax=Modestobacter sp. VKM Ac-2983 TaxID=3004137 RepID=UPI0022AB9555|nr:Brp/Blh family beta-carotene 15,15'-dioxygenase [Modestobacter sp. VKM Ac-2983]MCZ2805546.1 Brp/Blh family beta-carotene 15,15'-dioxygenase [Modestobacter sp. VKM Ac-2983]
MPGSSVVRRPASRAGAPRRGRRPVRAVGPALAAGAVGAQLLAPAALAQVAPAVALAGIVLGVPHGAVDHMVPFWTSGRRPAAAALARVLAGYTAVAGVAVGALLLAPTTTVAVFLVASAVHFGRAEVVVSAEDAGRRVPGPGQDWWPTAAHGLAVVAVPLVLWPGPSADVLGRIAPGWQQPLPLAGRAALGLGCLVALVVALRLQVGAGRRREAAELAGVAALFVVVPPLVAFGVWFAGWHALRHTERLVSLLRTTSPAGGTWPALRRFAAHAALPTVVTLAAVVVLAGGDTSAVAVSAALAVLVALTFPHVLTVQALDRWAAEQGRPGP